MSGYKHIETPEAMLWRYITLERFYELLQSSSLHFTHPSGFEDQFEFSLPTSQIMLLNSIPGEIGIEHREFYRKTESFPIGVVCFHIRDYEDSLMWATYGSEKGVALVTKTSLILNSLRESGHTLVRMGNVNYVNYDDPELGELNNLYDRILHKRKFFESEREARLILVHVEDDSDRVTRTGCGFLANLESLSWIQEIVISAALKGDIDSIREKAEKVGLNVPIRVSALSEKPPHIE
ncbi:hypothetical protein CCB80_09335 [Armatimonadetes bacterium Uphvl-Ar1]|nr:hypothetical protein CCB80_09335 [Armatimonadetes bacterium Uphvl-Ar1]